MSFLVNLHTHTTYCDGKNTPSDMAKSAFDQGFKCLGFSAHAPMSLKNDYCMINDKQSEYCKEIINLKAEYKDRMDIFLGLEADYFADPFNRENFDYIIGSVHHILLDGFYLCIDSSPIDMLCAISAYNKDINALIYDYYKQISDMPNKFKADIIGHFDIIAKYNYNSLFFDENDGFYRKCALSALENLVDKGLYLEINTGAINKKYSYRIYPNKFILEHANNIGAKIVISSDSHECDTLAQGFANAVQLAKSCGYKTAFKLTKSGFKEFELDELII